MAHGFKHDSMLLPELCEHIYHAFGQYAVYNLVRDRQNEGYLSDVEWRDCLGCEDRTPHYNNSCLICGGN